MAEHVALSVYFFLLFVCLSVLAENVNDENYASTLNYDEDTFKAGLSKRRNFVMFYAPWCGHCKNLSPTWDELAKIYNKAEDSPVVIAKVDCTIHTSLCADHEVVGFPTLKLFETGGEEHKRYTGKRDLESLKAYVQEQVLGIGGEDTAVARETGEEDSKEATQESKVVILNDDNFADTVSKGFYFIKFYAPWCGHCKRLAPVWEDLASSFGQNDNVAIAELDCTQSTIVCKQFEIRGYPTLLWFKDGQKVDQFQAPRTLETLKNFVQERLSLKVKEQHGDEAEKVPDEEKDLPEGRVTDLTDETFKSQISTGLVFIKFFAPWCGHCKRLAPTWEDLAKAMSGQPVLIADVDCTQYKSICDENEIKGYPTLKLFRHGEWVKDYRGGRTLEEMSSFVKREMELRDEL
ncbi:Thioredoxin domain-containing protein 5 [Bulinus truncatus]|nr:Thioredoxin domain-containing protein 5 [Bulinus truncatus]